jgi:hypothetical protein
MKEIVLIVLSISVASSALAQDAPLTTRQLVAFDQVASASEFEYLCSGRDGAIWCDGYFSGIVAALGIANNTDCVRLVDVARFAHESVWLTTADWLYRQPDNLRITYFEAVRSALSEQELCDL